MKGFEPLTPSLPWKCSTPELHRPLIRLWLLKILENLSGRRDSNPRPSAWKADALPTELLPHTSNLCHGSCGDDRIRTYSAKSNRFTVCPVSPTSAHPLTIS